MEVFLNDFKIMLRICGPTNHQLNEAQEGPFLRSGEVLGWG